jgi:hypothetical protein
MNITALPAATKESSTSAAVVRGTLSAVVFSEVLQPLAAGLGPAGDMVVERIVDGLFVNAKR